jgi:ATP-dependent exoDNAse (exonuclease V) beta subunit
MTVHKAKGLEFPVVILADITCRLFSDRPSRALVSSRGLCVQTIAGCTPAELVELRAAETARDRAEGHRLAYVAATRARDLLVVPGVGDEPYPHVKQGEKWVDVMNLALYPDRPWPGPEVAVGCPPFGRDTVLDRPDEESAMHATPIRPGRYVRGDAAASFDVTWWDPAQLHLDVEPSLGARQKALIDKNASESRVREGHEAVDHWAQLHASRLAAGRVPSLRVQRVTEVAQALDLAGSDVAVLQVPSTTARRGGRAFGTLVHDVLARVGLDATHADVSIATAYAARVLGDGDVDQSAVVAAVCETLQHPLLKAAAAAHERGQCRRETPVTLRLEDGAWIEGQLDLAFEDAGSWTVVDFKTDADMDAGLDAYRRQVALYARALATATGQPARGVLLRI